MTDDDETEDDQWQQAVATLRVWCDQGRSVEQFKEAVIAQQYQQGFPETTPADTELWERAIGTDGVELPPLVRLRLQGFTWYQAIGCLRGLWISRPEDTDKIDQLSRELTEKDQIITAGSAENRDLRAQLKDPTKLDQETYNRFSEHFRDSTATARMAAARARPPTLTVGRHNSASDGAALPIS
jgi:hypothetical protein